VGITSPPASTGITQAVPLHPGAYNPEPDRPVNFVPRDARLDDRQNRRVVEDALQGIADPIKRTDRATMLQTYGLQHFYLPPRLANNAEDVAAARENSRLESLREKHTLLRDVCVAFPEVKPRRHEVPKQSWNIQDTQKFAALLTLIRENVDYLIKFMDVQSRVDRAMSLDIRAMGWHPSEDMVRISRNTWKLSLLNQAAEELYPEYSNAAQEALDNITDQWKGTQGYTPRPDNLNPVIEKAVLHSPSHSRANSPERSSKKGGLFGFRPKIFGMFSSGSDHKSHDHHSDPSTPIQSSGPARSNSLSGVTPANKRALDPPRSQSIHGDNDLERTRTYESLDRGLSRMDTLSSQISRHDMFPGAFRVQSKQGKDGRH